MMNNPMAGMGGMNGMGNIMGMLQQLKANPVQFLMQRKFNLPQGISTNDPQAILNHLMQSGQINQNQINQAYQMMQRMGK